MTKEVAELVRRAPILPGVYLMYDKAKKLLYIGKAKKLRDRLTSYINPEHDERISVRVFVPRIHHIEWIITDNEKEAYLLEASLIRSKRPKYNVELRDDKSYVSLKLSHHNYPRLNITRSIVRDRGTYFGPYDSVKSVRSALKLVQKIFKLRDCSDSFFNARKRPCLKYQIARCSAPCVSFISQKDYASHVEAAKTFLRGKKESLLKSLELQMTQAAAELRYEDAVRFRDQIKGIQQTLSPQRVENYNVKERLTVLAVHQDHSSSLLKIMHVINGRITNMEERLIEQSDVPREEIIQAYLQSLVISEWSFDNRLLPDRILLEENLEDLEIIEETIFEKFSKKIRLHIPKKGSLLKFLKIAQKNAELTFAEKKRKSELNSNLLESLQRQFRLKNFPERIECYDISTFHGAQPVGSQVVFVNGESDKTQYRHYRIKTVKGSNDFAMMREMLDRRANRIEENNMPQLWLIDGGKGQMAQAVEVLKKYDLWGKIDLLSLAKEKTWKVSGGENSAPERIFIPGQMNAVVLKPSSPILHLLMRLRDEAHRFGITHHRKRRQKESLESVLSHIPNIGPQKQKILLRALGSFQNIKEADLETLLQVPGLGANAAQSVRTFFETQYPIENE